jgi:hypothetical protein
MTHDNTPTSQTPTPAEAAAIVRGHRAQQGEAPPDRPAPSPHDARGGSAGHEDHGHGHGDGIHMPSPSVWPIVSAFGITMISFGILTGWAFGIFGGVVLAISLWKWAGEMRRDAA